MSGPDSPSPAVDWPAIFHALGVDPLAQGLQIVPAAALAPAPPLPHAAEAALGTGAPPLDRLVYAPPAFDPMRPLLVYAADAGNAGQAIAALRQHYPAAHRVTALDPSGAVRQTPLDQVAGFRCLFLPPAAPLDLPQACESLRYIVARLRGPGGCPWDREQTHASLKPYLVEEAYEALEALEEANAVMLREELGDLLLQILLHAQLAAESGQFDLDDVVEGIARKLVRRHPHVFGEVQVASAQEVLLT
ncbi:MAG: MazG family protein, partial [Chloroflexi bacterium]|nr:MazG family protein [Chloroflexota bacterium]